MAQGFSGCASFDCFGAGQRATALFAGNDWRASPEVASPMFTTSARLRTLHELLAMATLALPRAHDADAGETVRQVLAHLARLCERDEPVDGVALRRQVLQQIRSALHGVKSE